MKKILFLIIIVATIILFSNLQSNRTNNNKLTTPIPINPSNRSYKAIVEMYSNSDEQLQKEAIEKFSNGTGNLYVALRYMALQLDKNPKELAFVEYSNASQSAKKENFK